MAGLPPSTEAVQSRVTVADTQQQELLVTQSSFNIPTGTVTVVSSRRISIPTAEDESKFRQLADQWRSETRFSSSSTDNLSNPAYVKIIGMGPRATPLILKELQERGGHWFLALEYIVDTNPFAPEDAGNVTRMTEAWIEWGRQHDYL